MNQNELKYDVLIVGGGIAGLTAGVRAAELGLKPLVLEQGDGIDYPNNSRQSGGILHIGFHDPYRPPQELEQIIERITEGEAKPELARALSQTGARLISWLQGHGAKFMRFNPQEGYRWCMAPPRALRAGLDWKERGPDLTLRRLAKDLAAQGGMLQLRTKVMALEMEGGRCIGVRTTCDGRFKIYSAPYTIIADGGFQSNRKFFEKYIGIKFDAVFQRGARTGFGDGLSMALDAGAAVTTGNRFYGHVLCSDAKHNDQVWPYPEVDAIATAGLVVDGTGKRIVDEGVSGVHLANELAAHATTEKLFAVFDSTIWAGPGTSARIPANPLLENAGGTILRAQSAHELAELMGVPGDALASTLTEFNQALLQDKLESLAVPRSTKIQAFAIEHAPLMAIPVCPGITYTMDGIDIDGQAQVLDADKKPIAGLFAAGATTGGLEGGKNSAYIGGLIKAGSFGLIAAERIATLEGKAFTVIQPQATTQIPVKVEENKLTAHSEPKGIEQFPILRTTIRYGKPIAYVMSALLGLFVYFLISSTTGLLAVPLSIAFSLVVLVLTLGLVELIKLITQFLMPDQNS